jgi:ornithine carbamoyltransferase
LKGKDFLTLGEFSSTDLSFVLDLSAKLKTQRKRKHFRSWLDGFSAALIFQKPSTRTRMSFQVAIRELGGYSMALNSNELQLGRGETVEDTARVMSRYVDLIAARVNLHRDIAKLAAFSTVPVINALSDQYHPVQILADLLTLREKKRKLEGLKVVWIGDGNNVCNSWLLGAALTGINFVATTPPQYRPSQSAVKKATKLAESTGARIVLTEDPLAGVKDADCVITDTFVSMGFDEEREKRLAEFLPKYRVDETLMSHAKKDAIFEHCLPAHREEEVTAGVIDGPQSVVWDEAENRLHTTKALILLMLLGQKRAAAKLRNP